MTGIQHSESKSASLLRPWLDSPYATRLAEDREFALSLSKPLGCANPTFVLVEGEPRSKSRPTHQDNSKQNRQNAELRFQLQNSFPIPLTGNLAVACIFYRSSRKRIDIDNLFKEVFDAANGIAWHDDMQVTACTGMLKLDATYPRVAVLIGNVASSLDRAETVMKCQFCGKPFHFDRCDSGRRKFCSRICQSTSRRKLFSGIPPIRRYG